MLASAPASVDVLVVGGGHAGCEAAAAAARCGARTLLVTPAPRASVGEMSCNPSIGGLAKGVLVREVDALDGVMGVAADHAGIQFHMLNASKGPAVRGPRAQMDRQLYKAAVQALLGQTPGLAVLDDAVADLLLQSRSVTASGEAPREGGAVQQQQQQHHTVVGVRLASGAEVAARSVVITTGTFLRGMLHIGSVTRPAGRMPTQNTHAADATAAGAASALAATLARCGFTLGRLKTGTPPRLDGRSIDWSGLEEQPGDAVPTPFSFLHASVPAAGPGWRPPAAQISCFSTRTTEETERVVASLLAQRRGATYDGGVNGVGVGPRYCPSLEAKVRRFPGRTHTVWLEPEGLTTDVVYPNGLSNAFEPSDQLTMLRTIPGLRDVVMLQPGCVVRGWEIALLPVVSLLHCIPVASDQRMWHVPSPGTASSTTSWTPGSCVPPWKPGPWRTCTWRAK